MCVCVSIYVYNRYTIQDSVSAVNLKVQSVSTMFNPQAVTIFNTFI